MPVIRFFENWSYFVLLLCLYCGCIKAKLAEHHHQHHHLKSPVPGSDNKMITFADRDYKYRPAIGEILAKDSILYSHNPESRQLRRQLWPLMQDTMTTLVDSVSAGADLLKNMFKTKPNPIATKIRNIKNTYISATTSAAMHKKNTKTTTPKRSKKPMVKHSPGRSKTVSGDYVHTYNNGAYNVPNYVIKSATKNPYSAMGMKDYKHFENTVLRELEKKEEKKVEATMHTIFGKGAKNVEDHVIQQTPYDDWRPITSPSDDGQNLRDLKKPRPVGKLHTSIADFNEIKPIHETVDESKTFPQIYKTNIETPATSSNNSKRRRPSNRSTSSTTTASAPRPFAQKPTTEGPNYPEYFLKNHKQLGTNNQNLQIDTKDTSSEISYLKRMKFYRKHLQSFTTPSSPTTTNGSTLTRESLLVDASHDHPKITPLPKVGENINKYLKKNLRFNRQKTKLTTDDGKDAGVLSSTNRGRIKFGDKIQLTEIIA